MKTAVIGATGFIGKNLIEQMLDKGNHAVAITRTHGKANSIFGEKAEEFVWDGKDEDRMAELAGSVDAIVNLAGENLASGRWTDSKKKRIYDSRVSETKSLANAILKADKKPKIVVQGSATGIYGLQYDGLKDDPAFDDSFLSQVCVDWETAIEPVSKAGIPVVLLRTGVVLGVESGMLPRVLTPMKLFAGGHTGNGKQWISWIHKDDLTRAILFLLEKREPGPYNITAPGPLTQKNFFKILGKVLNRPSWLHVPAFMLRIIFGQMADETLLASQRALPDRLLEEGFSFNHPDLESALKNLLKSNP
jgi:hypothetical protein